MATHLLVYPRTRALTGEASSPSRQHLPSTALPCDVYLAPCSYSNCSDCIRHTWSWARSEEHGLVDGRACVWARRPEQPDSLVISTMCGHDTWVPEGAAATIHGQSQASTGQAHAGTPQCQCPPCVPFLEARGSSYPRDLTFASFKSSKSPVGCPHREPAIHSPKGPRRPTFDVHVSPLVGPKSATRSSRGCRRWASFQAPRNAWKRFVNEMGVILCLFRSRIK